MKPGTLIGAVEAGGTKFVCGVGTGPGAMPLKTRIATTTPAETLGRVVDFFREAEKAARQPLTAWGVATFGPAGVLPGKPDYGFITTTPKPGWANTDLLGALLAHRQLPACFDTDVNGAAVGEWRWGAGQGCRSVLYLTVGTGIGGGLAVDGVPLHGLGHPEMGHVLLPRPPGETSPGTCPWHGACLEGLASGPAIAARWGTPAETLPADHPAWTLEVEYLALAMYQFTLTLSPERIILGGGVGSRPHLLPPLRKRLAELLNGYVPAPEVVNPGLGDGAGLLGAVALGLGAGE